MLQQICNNWFKTHNSLPSDVFRSLLGALQSKAPTSCKMLNVLGAVCLIIPAFGRVVGFYRKSAHQTKINTSMQSSLRFFRIVRSSG